MCAHVISALREHGWVVYPECFDYDFVAVTADGTRYGVEAKLKGNLKVLDQASGHRSQKQVHFRVVLVPDCISEFLSVAWKLQLGALVCGTHIQARDVPWYLEHSCKGIPRNPYELLPLPTVLLETPAGVPCPRKLTKWKLAAVQFCLDHASSEEITRKDLVTAGLHPAIWTQRDWLVPVGSKAGPNGRAIALYKLGAGAGRPDLWYPEIADAIRARDALKSAA